MKKRFLGGLVAMALLVGTCGAAFRDIQAPELAQTAAVLKSLKIMEGDSGGTFAPNRSLTRAEFAKLVVTAFGVTDVTAYKSYTVFPDVPGSHWAAGYINAAVKHPDIKGKSIIHGYADGTFQPDRTINYGEACTMLMLMLGYSIEDIGHTWPGDYIARAQSEGLADGASVMTASSPVSRGDAAIMLLNTLDTPGKEDSKLINLLTSSSDSEGAILLATSETDGDLRKNQARFYTGGDEPVTKTTDGVLDSALIGVSGTIYYSKTSPNTVLTIVPDNKGRSEAYEVRRVQRDRIETTGEETVKPERDVLLYVNGEVARFSETWFDIQPGDAITLHYDEAGALELISVAERGASENSFVYGTKNAAGVPSNFTILKNGVRVSADLLKPYDVVTMDAAAKTAEVSDVRVTGYYDSGKPSIKSPETIEMLGQNYKVSERAATYFADFKAGDRITVLFDARGAVAAAFPASDLRADMAGVFSGMNGGDAIVTLWNGVTVRGPLSSTDDKKLFGQPVTVSGNSDGELSLSSRSLSGKPSGDWDVDAGTLGGKKVSPDVRIWEQVEKRAPLYETTFSELPSTVIRADSIRSVVTDSTGSVIAFVLGDVTGNAWNYGYGYYTEGRYQDGNGEYQTTGENVATLRFYDYSDKTQKELTYRVVSKPDGVGSGPIGFPKGAENNETRQFLSSIRLAKVDTVGLSAFDGVDGVRTASGYYPVSDEVQVYLPGTRKFMTLNQAKADYENFTLYAERTAEKGGKIRIITVS